MPQPGNAARFKFPEPQIPGLNFSFSGLKTAILYFIQNEKAKDPEFIAKNLAGYLRIHTGSDCFHPAE